MSYKDMTNQKLLEFYRINGLERTIAVARAMLESTKHKEDQHFRNHSHGEICETVLECLVTEHIKQLNLSKYGWFFKKGLILKDINKPDSGYFTELDFTVFTPQKIFAFECKSYSGDNRITDKCTIRRKKGSSFDVYDQHSKHFMVLADQLQPFRIVNKENSLENPYQLILFDFSLGTTTDERATKEKLIMPCLNETNVLNIFKTLYNSPVMWDIERVHRAMDIIEKHSIENRERHLKYVQSLKH